MYIHIIALLFAFSAPSLANWWQFGEYVEKNYLKYGVYVSINCSKWYLPPAQQSQCTDPRNELLMTRLALAINLAVNVCNETFRCSLWNCPYSGGPNLFGPLIGNGNRETAVAYAITSAFAAYTITRDCAAMLFNFCGCDSTRRRGRNSPELLAAAAHYATQYPETKKEDYEWGSCSEDTDYGYDISKRFIDVAEVKGADGEYGVRERMNVHNNEVGRLIVKKSLVLKCACFGLTYSCTVLACRYEMREWQEIGRMIREKYNNAVQAKLSDSNQKFVDGGGSTVSQNTLVYVNATLPDLCKGSVGRSCNTSSSGDECLCDRLCCLRGYKTKVRTVQAKCDCVLKMFPPPIRFVCKRCTKVLEEHYCH